MTCTTVRRAHAAKFAKAYHDVMTMSRDGSTFQCTDQDPQQVLGTYLYWCDITGIRLHDTTWLEDITTVVERIQLEQWKAMQAVIKRELEVR